MIDMEKELKEALKGQHFGAETSKIFLATIEEYLSMINDIKNLFVAIDPEHPTKFSIGFEVTKANPCLEISINEEELEKAAEYFTKPYEGSEKLGPFDYYEPPKCECGAKSCGYGPGPNHSTWCDLFSPMPGDYEF